MDSTSKSEFTKRNFDLEKFFEESNIEDIKL